MGRTLTQYKKQKGASIMGSILYAIAVILFAIWLIGLVAHVSFAAIHLLIVIAVVLVVWNLVTGNRGRRAV